MTDLDKTVDIEALPNTMSKEEFDKFMEEIRKEQELEAEEENEVQFKDNHIYYGIGKESIGSGEVTTSEIKQPGLVDRLQQGVIDYSGPIFFSLVLGLGFIAVVGVVSAIMFLVIARLFNKE